MTASRPEFGEETEIAPILQGHFKEFESMRERLNFSSKDSSNFSVFA
jgi:hypothetical protein